MNLAYALTEEDIDLSGRCPICNIEFIPHVETMTFFQMTAQPTIDRVDNTGGYVPSNIAVICATCNRIKGTLNAHQARAQAGRLIQIAEFIDAHEASHE